ncbi:phage holin family protein [Candidatus Nomurabacteria bacterium]|nr:phage holin family protein [Candidatus Nomurabacteria bacterium]USN94901.1 MAG: phage holin family protein [Candidatus Nomurabacteria bacterium]
MKIIVHWLILTLAVFAVPYFVGGISVDSVVVAIIVGACLAFINMVVKPVISILTLPINIITLGLFSLVINAGLFYLVSTVVEGFSVDGFMPALWGSLVVSIINWFSGKVVRD